MPADPYPTFRAELAHFGPDPDPDASVTLPVREARALLEERDRLREALAELVRLKKLKDDLGWTAEYEEGKPAAWEAARRALETSDAG